MQLYMPTKVYSEDDCVLAHAAQLRKLGRKAMIVTGKTSAVKTGALGDVVSALGDTPYVLFDRIEENPSIETVMVARDLAIAEKADFFIGIGGGSAMDAAKAISLMAANPDLGQEILYDPTVRPYLPVACVPTTCGTGSEVTPYAILTIHARQTKKSISHRIYPELALMDAKYLKTLPRSVLVSTCTDALSHLLESYLHTGANDLNRVYSREGMRLWGAFKNRLLNDSVMDRDYADMLHASMLAGMAITHTSTSLPHALSYALTYHLGTPHGKACGYFLGGYVDTYGDKALALEAVGLLGFETTGDFRQYLTQLLGLAQIDEDLLKSDAQKVFSDTSKLKTYPFPVTEDLLIGMLN